MAPPSSQLRDGWRPPLQEQLQEEQQLQYERAVAIAMKMEKKHMYNINNKWTTPIHVVEMRQAEEEGDSEEEEEDGCSYNTDSKKKKKKKQMMGYWRGVVHVVLLRAHEAIMWALEKKKKKTRKLHSSSSNFDSSAAAAATTTTIHPNYTWRDCGDQNSKKKLLYAFLLRFFLALALFLLLFDIVVHRYLQSMGGHLLQRTSSSSSTTTLLLHSAYLCWVNFRARYLAPPLQSLANVCIALFLIQSADRLIQCLGCVWIRLKKIRPIAVAAQMSSSSFSSRNVDPEQPSSAHPMVLVQIPMCNEREVYQQSIGAVAQLDWPKDRLLIQVLDDSDDPETQMLIHSEVQKWHQKGVNIVYRHRVVRTGYKAGNLKSAMTCDYVKDYEFVAIFDADFQPQPDFLNQTVIYFQGNDDVGLVQARWSFINKNENLLTRLQYINLSYHFEVEQQVNGIFLNFFGFNGTAGVWRIKALEESGGWMERTTVEDMDIAVRAHLKGWKFIFLNDVKCLCEVPESYEAYRKQQHRWHSGPMQLFRLCLPDIIRARISILKKANLIFLFFLLRKLVLPFYSFTLFCIILPMTMFIPEAHLPAWVVCYVPAVMSFVNIVPAPKSLPFIVPYLLFENTMSVTKFNAMVSGLFQLGSAYEWVVTKKVGRASESDLLAFAEKEAHAGQDIGFLHRGASESGLDELNKQKKQTPKPRQKKVNRIYKKELALAFLLLTASARSLLSVQGVHFYFLLFQGISFLVVGLDLIGERVG